MPLNVRCIVMLIEKRDAKGAAQLIAGAGRRLLSWLGAAAPRAI